MKTIKHISRQLDPNGANLASIKDIKGNKDAILQPQRKASSEGNFYQDLDNKIGP